MSDLNKKLYKIKTIIEKRSPFDRKETSRILHKFFNHVLSLVRIVVDEYKFDDKKVLDIGCAYGNALLFFGEGSEGVEIKEHAANFLKSLGRKVYQINIENGMKELKNEDYEAIYCAAVIEHLLSPHFFLARLHSLLKSEGILALAYPVVPPLFFKKLLEHYRLSRLVGIRTY